MYPNDIYDNLKTFIKNAAFDTLVEQKNTGGTKNWKMMNNRRKTYTVNF